MVRGVVDPGCHPFQAMVVSSHWRPRCPGPGLRGVLIANSARCRSRKKAAGAACRPVARQGGGRLQGGRAGSSTHAGATACGARAWKEHRVNPGKPDAGRRCQPVGKDWRRPFGTVSRSGRHHGRHLGRVAWPSSLVSPELQFPEAGFLQEWLSISSEATRDQHQAATERH